MVFPGSIPAALHGIPRAPRTLSHRDIRAHEYTYSRLHVLQDRGVSSRDPKTPLGCLMREKSLRARQPGEPPVLPPTAGIGDGNTGMHWPSWALNRSGASAG